MRERARERGSEGARKKERERERKKERAKECKREREKERKREKERDRERESERERVGCNNGIGGFSKTLSTCRESNLPDFSLAQKMHIKNCSSNMQLKRWQV